MNNTNIEVRNYGTIQIRKYEDDSVDNSRHIEGYAIVFDSPSLLLNDGHGNAYEVINRGAVTQELLNNSDVFCLLNHEEDKVLARSNKGQGSLVLEIDEHGLKYSFDAPNTDLGNTLLEHIKRGEINTSSFAYANYEDKDVDYKIIDGARYRIVNTIRRLYDCSPVYTAAFPETSVSKRAFPEINISKRALERLTQLDEDAEKEKIKQQENTILNKVRQLQKSIMLDELDYIDNNINKYIKDINS